MSSRYARVVYIPSYDRSVASIILNIFTAKMGPQAIRSGRRGRVAHAACSKCGGSGMVTCICSGAQAAVQLCAHNRRKRDCKQCGSKCFCVHDRRLVDCKQCGGAATCEHNKVRKRCALCKSDSVNNELDLHTRQTTTTTARNARIAQPNTNEPSTHDANVGHSTDTEDGNLYAASAGLTAHKEVRLARMPDQYHPTPAAKILSRSFDPPFFLEKSFAQMYRSKDKWIEIRATGRWIGGKEHPHVPKKDDIVEFSFLGLARVVWIHQFWSSVEVKRWLLAGGLGRCGLEAGEKGLEELFGMREFTHERFDAGLCYVFVPQFLASK